MKYDFLVVLCGDNMEDTMPRLNPIINIEDKTKYIVVSGRSRVNHWVIADWMKAYLVSLGINPKKVIRERKAINTISQIFRLIHLKGKKLAIVSNKDHLEWIGYVCEDMKVKAELIACEEI